jgi:hypothetical protein
MNGWPTTISLCHFDTYLLAQMRSDEGNQQDPEEVLKRWKASNTGLEYWIVNASSFMHRHGQASDQDESSTKSAHHSFVNRQRGFVSACVEFMKAQGLRWVTLIDSDEFVVINLIGRAKNLTVRPSTDPQAVDRTAYEWRKAIPQHDSGVTVLDTISELSRIKTLSPCYTLPRVLFAALENVSCPEAEFANELANSSFHFHEMSTLRYNQHATKSVK